MSALSFTSVRDQRPLPVQVYDRLYDALTTPEHEGLEIPTELELVDQLGVSRTTVRQALALLEEDGVLERGPGRRRIVAQRRKRSGSGPFSLEEMIDSAFPVLIRSVSRRPQSATRWSSELLGVAHGTELMGWESLAVVDGIVVASALELTTLETWTELELELAEDRTLLTVLGRAFRVQLHESLCRITANVADTRDQFDRPLEAEQGGPTVVVTQVLDLRERPAYLAKHIVRLEHAPLSLVGRDGAQRA